MVGMIIKVLIVYSIAGVVIGLIDVARVTSQEEYLSQFPIGDIGEYVFPKKILGVHNFVFCTSWIVIGAVVMFNMIRG